jgi:hypothetical protein
MSWIIMVKFSEGVGMFLFTSIMTSSEDLPATYPMNTEALSPEVMLLEQEHEHALPSTVDDKNA